MPILEKASARKQLFFLLVIILASVLIISPLGILIAYPFVNGNIFELMANMHFAKNAQDIALLKYFQIVSQISLFIVSSYLFTYSISKKPFAFLNLNKKPQLSLIGISIILGLVSTPFLNWIMEWNSSIHFPAFLSSVENWMRNMEVEASRLTSIFIQGNHFSDLLINLFMMALLAGLGEELLLRGLFQPLLIRLTKNAHWGIWLAAGLFSFMHFQFFGFIPRLLLGALFGYYYYWSKNLWIPIIAHVLNNGIIVIYAFATGATTIGPNINETKPFESSSVLLILVSLSFTLLGLMYFYRESDKNKSFSE
jgi:membrane protease YdiL (CAAX protease family)